MREPICTGGAHRGDGRDNYHDHRCYRRIRPDKTRVAIDSDIKAVAWAALAALACPVIAFAWLVRVGAPELPNEKEARLRKLDEAITERERQLGGDGPAHLGQ
jgi:hypothetical protein